MGFGNQIVNYKLDSTIRNGASNPGHSWQDVNYSQTQWFKVFQVVRTGSNPGRIFLGKKRRKVEKMQTFCFDFVYTSIVDNMFNMTGSSWKSYFLTQCFRPCVVSAAQLAGLVSMLCNLNPRLRELFFESVTLCFIKVMFPQLTIPVDVPVLCNFSVDREAFFQSCVLTVGLFCQI